MTYTENIKRKLFPYAAKIAQKLNVITQNTIFCKIINQTN